MSLDVKVVKNTNARIEFSVKNRSGNSINITDYDIKWQIKKSLNGIPLITKTTQDSGIILTDEVNGKFQVKIEPEDTNSLPAGEYYHEALLTTPAGEYVTLTNNEFNAGIFLLRDQYTKP